MIYIYYFPAERRYMQIIRFCWRFIWCMGWSSKRGKWHSQINSHPKHLLSDHVSEDLPQVKNWCWLEARCGLCVASFQLEYTLFQNMARVSLCWIFELLLACISKYFWVSFVIYLSTIEWVIHNENCTNGISTPFCEQTAKASNRFIIQIYW